MFLYVKRLNLLSYIGFLKNKIERFSKFIKGHVEVKHTGVIQAEVNYESSTTG